MLLGSEVKSMRESQVQLGDAFARIRNGEMWLEGMHVSPYSFAIGFGAHDPDRARKLLLHKDEITRLKSLIDRERVVCSSAQFVLQRWTREGRTGRG